MSPPCRPFLLPGESLISLLARYCDRNRVPLPALIRAHDCGPVLHDRALPAPRRLALAHALGLDPTGWDHALLSDLPAEVVGDPTVGPGTRKPLGWASTYHSSRCSQCQRDGAPWLVTHQTGLAWVCPTHDRFLQAHCVACCPRIATLSGRPVACSHHATPPSLTPDLVQLQNTLQQRLDVAADGQGHGWFTALRATAAVAYVDAALGQRSPHLSDHTVDYATALHGRIRDRSGGRVGLRLHRPPHDPWVNAHLVRTSLHHLDDQGRSDHDWIHHVAGDLAAQPALARRAEPFLAALGVVLPGRRATPKPIHRSWRDLAARLSEDVSAAGFGAHNIPAALRCPGETLRGRWVNSLSRAVLLHEVLTGEPPTVIVKSLGHHFTHVQSVLTHLREPATAQQAQAFEGAVAALLLAPPFDFADARRTQSAVGKVSAVVLRALHLEPPSTQGCDAGQTAAAWLWCTVTSGHPVAVPFVDGRTLNSHLARILEWQATTPVEGLVALLEWNSQNLELPIAAADAPVATPRTRAKAG